MLYPKLKANRDYPHLFATEPKYRENNSSTPGGEGYGNVTASNALFIKKQTTIFFYHSGFDYLYHRYYLIIL